MAVLTSQTTRVGYFFKLNSRYKAISRELISHLLAKKDVRNRLVFEP